MSSPSYPDTDHDTPQPDSPDQNPDTNHDTLQPDSPDQNPDTDHDTPQPDSPNQNPDTDHNTPQLDRDSAFGDRSRSSSTQTLPSSFREYRQQYGRTYHNYEGCLYPYPNDERELDRLDWQHDMFLRLFGGKLHLAPISPFPHNILDIGTGTGIWAIDVARLYPSAHVIGTDISPTQPNWLRPNCEFQVDNANEDWDFTEEFNLVHCRELLNAVREKRLFKQSFDTLKEGGWFEIKEFALPLYCTENGTYLARWGEAMMAASKKIGTPFDNPHKYRQWMEEVGFVNVEEFIYHVPLNEWSDPGPKEVGRAQMMNFLLGVEGFSLALFREHLKWSKEELEVLLAYVRRDIQNREVHGHRTLVCVIGQKPPKSTTL